MRVFKEGETVTKVEVDQMVLNIHKPKFVKYTLKDNEKVYIIPKSTMPRLKFKKNFPNNKIVHDPIQADVFIATDDLGYFGNTSHILFNGNYQHGNGWGYDKDVILVERTVDILNKISAIHYISDGKKPLIRDTDILYKGEIPRIMTDEEYNSIAKMLSSGEKEMMNLGMEMLLGFDHTINEKNYVLLFAQINGTYWIKKSRIFKSILKTLKVKYVNLR